MRKKSSIFTLLLTLVVILCSGLPAWGIDYAITKVVEIGPADWVPMQGPLKWSPDGNWIAYYHDGWLMLSDTLGKSRQIWRYKYGPHLQEWLSNEEIIVREWDPEYGQTRHKISIIDLRTGDENILIEETQPWKGARKGQFNEYEGPGRTVEGNIYYAIKKGNDIRAILPKPKSSVSQKSLNSEDNHVVRWSKSGIYLVRCDFKDSTRLGPWPFHYIHMPATLSPDGNYAIVYGLMENLSDSTRIALDTIIKDNSHDYIGCGFPFCYFNPESDEILFHMSCELSESEVVNCIGTFDYLTNEYSIIDSLIGIYECTTPAYSPDGIKIAFLANCKAYIIYRDFWGERK